jgi:hypothetical protein
LPLDLIKDLDFMIFDEKLKKSAFKKNLGGLEIFHGMGL